MTRIITTPNNTLIKKITVACLLGLLLLQFTSCGIRKRPMYHYVVRSSDFASLKEWHTDGRFIIIFNTYSKDIKRVADEIIDERIGIYRKIENCSSKIDRLFLLAIHALDWAKRETALTYLKQLPSDAFDGQVGLLRLDCELRLGIEQDYQSKYQELYDKASRPIIKELIQIHYTFYKYESQELLLLPRPGY